MKYPREHLGRSQFEGREEEFLGRNEAQLRRNSDDKSRGEHPPPPRGANVSLLLYKYKQWERQWMRREGIHTSIVASVLLAGRPGDRGPVVVHVAS